LRFHQALQRLSYWSMQNLDKTPHPLSHLEQVWEETDQETTKRMLLLATVSIATSTNDQDLLQKWLPQAVQGLGIQGVEEIILQTLLFVGFPKTIEALVTLRRHYPVSDSGDPSNDRWKAGLDLSRKVYGPHHEKLLRHMD
jgi:alkylhydroperoxidase/carboxymuconolactone decarboxylase family protein YurZ